MNICPCAVYVLVGKADNGLENNYMVLEIEKRSRKITQQGNGAQHVREWFGIVAALVV